MDNNTYNPAPNFNQPTAAPQPVMPPQQPEMPQMPQQAPQSMPPMGAAPKKKLFDNLSTVQMVILIVVSLLAVLFIGLFIWMLVMWLGAKNDVDTQIDEAVSAAVSATETRLQAEFSEQEKYPYSTFTGPSDLGSLSFEFPKTWSVYVANDSSTGDYEAYLNPDIVSPVSTTTINALRVIIRSQSIDNVTRTYDNLIKQGVVTVTTRPINGETTNVYSGSLSTDIQGMAAVFKIRDKTAIVQTDAMVFSDDFTHVLDSIKYNS